MKRKEDMLQIQDFQYVLKEADTVELLRRAEEAMQGMLVLNGTGPAPVFVGIPPRWQENPCGIGGYCLQHLFCCKMRQEFLFYLHSKGKKRDGVFRSQHGAQWDHAALRRCQFPYDDARGRCLYGIFIVRGYPVSRDLASVSAGGTDFADIDRVMPMGIWTYSGVACMAEETAADRGEGAASSQHLSKADGLLYPADRVG